ncbi:GAF domain-containing protein [Muricoccus radiodurans]|uniref:GAF domain-containing protein n=1 Tax=Muricoccus radiodurans TaxID=2231721 RepID=UPI003CF7BBD0
MSATSFSALAEALAAPDQPASCFAALDKALQDEVGHRFLTVLVYRWKEGVAERLYSSRPTLYPARGRKAFSDAPTQRRVAETREPYIGRDAADIRRDFPDHEKIFALDCESILNMPVVWQGRGLGQVNLLHAANHYGPAQIPVVRVLAQMCIPVLLAADRDGSR